MRFIVLLWGPEYTMYWDPILRSAVRSSADRPEDLGTVGHRRRLELFGRARLAHRVRARGEGVPNRPERPIRSRRGQNQVDERLIESREFASRCGSSLFSVFVAETREGVSASV